MCFSILYTKILVDHLKSLLENLNSFYNYIVKQKKKNTDAEAVKKKSWGELKVRLSLKTVENWQDNILSAVLVGVWQYHVILD